jgi:hypothetical protein
VSTIQDAIPDYLDLGWDGTCQVYRCPRCNTWDWALQGSIEDGDVVPGVYNCWSCGTVFRIRDPKEEAMPYPFRTEEDEKEVWKAVAGLVFIVSVVVLVLLGYMR